MLSWMVHRPARVHVPVTVNVSKIAPTPDDVAIVDICQYNQCFLRSFRYSHSTLPDNHFLAMLSYILFQMFSVEMGAK